jgi:hypothetical protein
MHDAPHAASRFIFQERYAMVDSIKLDSPHEVVNISRADIDKMKREGGGTIEIGGQEYKVEIAGKTVNFPSGSVSSDIHNKLKQRLECRLEGIDLLEKYKDLEKYNNESTGSSDRRRTSSTQSILSNQDLLAPSSTHVIKPTDDPSKIESHVWLKKLHSDSTKGSSWKDYAAFGFGSIRMCFPVSDSESKQIMEMTTIDELNHTIGVRFPSDPAKADDTSESGQPIFNPETYLVHYKSYMEENLNLSPPEATTLPPPLSAAWHNMLYKSLGSSPERFNMFKRIQIMVQIADGESTTGATTGMEAKVKANGLNAEIGDLLRKNSSELNTAIMKASEEGKELILKKAVEYAIKIATDSDPINALVTNDNSVADDNSENKLYLREASAKHYFRNTSKLGLEFFKEQKIPVVFWLQDLGGKTITSTDTLKDDTHKKNYKKGYNKAITYKGYNKAIITKPSPFPR